MGSIFNKIIFYAKCVRTSEFSAKKSVIFILYHRERPIPVLGGIGIGRYRYIGGVGPVSVGIERYRYIPIFWSRGTRMHADASADIYIGRSIKYLSQKVFRRWIINPHLFYRK